MDLIFDPLQRPARKFVGIEITGRSWSGSMYWRDVLDPLLSFRERNAGFDKQLLLFADAAPSEQRELRKFCRNVGILMFEDELQIRNLDEGAILNLENSETKHRDTTALRQENRRVKKGWFRRG
jgi:hypothetical protein